MISLGGFIMHSRGHPVTSAHANILPFLAGIASILVLPLMFLNKKLISFAFLTNGMFAIIGTISMIHFAIVTLPRGANLSFIIMKTTLPDVLILWAVFLIGKQIFDLETTNANNLEAPKNKGKFIRFPNMGYWLIHLGALSMVYFLGHILWR
jgi:hypothetical protein